MESVMPRFINLFCLAVLCASASAFAGAPEAGSDSPPNIVVIISDDQGYQQFGFMGHPVVRTPHLDKLAGESLLFERGYVATGLCSPSLASMLTGLYPHQHGWTGNDPSEEAGGWGKRQAWIERFAANPQLPALLAEHGYLSLHTGKYWQGDPQKVSGFTDSMGETQRHGSPESLGIGRDSMQPIYNFIEKAESEGKPFMVWYAPFLPHTPHTPPERLLAKYKDKTANLELAKYYAMIEWFDETCGDLLKYLDDHSLRDNTIVLFIVDNGYGQGAPGYRGHKTTPWEQGVRTPIMVRWPGKVVPRRDTRNLAENIDIPVTALSAAGIPVPSSMQGINLMDEKAVAGRKCIFLEDFDHDMVAPDKPEATLEARSVIEGDWKLVVTYGEANDGAKYDQWAPGALVDGVYLFNLSKDPKESENLEAKHPEIVARLKQKLDDWWNPFTEPAPESLRPLVKNFPYRTADGHEFFLKAWYPPGWTEQSEPLPAVVMFFGGGWHGGATSQFDQTGDYLAKRGMIVLAPEYRTRKNGGVGPDTCLRDAKTAMRYISTHAAELGVDPQRIAAGGRSAGGHLAAACAFSKGFDTEGDDLSISTRPQALVLFNPVIDNGPGGFGHHLVKSYWEDFSPLHNITDDPPPTIFLTGDRDTYTPVETARKYQAEMEKYGGRCDLVVFEGGQHGCPFRADLFPQTLQSIDKFFVDLGYLAAKDQKPADKQTKKSP